MRLRIHHGATQVGGNCIELESGGQTLLIDLGMPLDSAPRVPDVAGLREYDPSLLGVVLSHPHLDHYGLLPSVLSALPVWIGRGAHRLLEAAAPFTAGARLPQAITPYDTGATFAVGPFAITPYLMDHSAYDAHALLIEADGQRVFYSGDFRGHGRKGYAFDRFCRCPPNDVDVLLMEGTTLGRKEPSLSERDVEDQTAALMRDAKGLTLLCFSGQNIDRFVTFLRACLRTGRTLVIDAYMANLIVALGLDALPDPRFDPRLRVYLPKAQKRMIVRDRRFDLIEPFARTRIYREALLVSPARFALTFRTSMIPDFAGDKLAGGRLIYSLWPGYLDRDRTDLRDWARGAGVGFDIVHASGHAGVDDLRRMAAAVQARRVIPIHTAHAERYVELFQNVEPLANGWWMEVGSKQLELEGYQGAAHA